MRSRNPLSAVKVVSMLSAIVAVGLSACMPPLPPSERARVVSSDEAPIPAPIAEAAQRAAAHARNICLGRGYGEASVTFDSSGAVTRAKVERSEEIVDADCVEAVFLKTRVPAFAGPSMTIIAGFELDAMRGPSLNPAPVDLRQARGVPFR